MKSDRAVRELARSHNIPLTKRVFFECRDDAGQTRTRFMDVPRPRDELLEELRELGAVA